MRDFFEIRKCRNGYLVFDESRYINGGLQSDPWVFENIESMFDFIRMEFIGEFPGKEDKTKEGEKI